ncbi:MAG TPA: T9SS type A sorting domain-containing protein [Flavipsychrobacter sp.]|nr:T9SS type A sorting domain-containing protein [Flavipsychrobacter sp.]
MKTTRLFFIISIVITTSVSYSARACTCLTFPPDFFQSINYWFQLTPNDSVHIVKAVKTGVVSGYGTTFKVLQYYCGNTYKDTIIVWGYAGLSCRTSFQGSGLPVGDTLILALRKDFDYSMEGPDETWDDFVVSYCGYNYLRLKRDSVFGGSAGSFSWDGYPLALFEDSLCKVLNNHCLLSVKEPESVRDFTVAPNPSTGKLTINFTIKGDCNIGIEVCNLAGQIVTVVKDKEHESEGAHDEWINISSLPPGTYFIRLWLNDEQQWQKFVKL